MSALCLVVIIVACGVICLSSLQQHLQEERKALSEDFFKKITSHVEVRWQLILSVLLLLDAERERIFFVVSRLLSDVNMFRYLLYRIGK